MAWGRDLATKGRRSSWSHPKMSAAISLCGTAWRICWTTSKLIWSRHSSYQTHTHKHADWHEANSQKIQSLMVHVHARSQSPISHGACTGKVTETPISHGACTGKVTESPISHGACTGSHREFNLSWYMYRQSHRESNLSWYMYRQSHRESNLSCTCTGKFTENSVSYSGTCRGKVAENSISQGTHAQPM